MKKFEELMSVSNEIENILGYAGRTSVVHRDDLAI